MVQVAGERCRDELEGLCSPVFQPGRRDLSPSVPPSSSPAASTSSGLKTQQEFGTTILECVDRGLAVMGRVPRQVIYSYLERAKNLKREEIPVDPDGFVLALEDLFGGGARIIERGIIREIELALGLQLHKDKLVEAICETRIRLRGVNPLVGASPVPPSKLHGRRVQKAQLLDRSRLGQIRRAVPASRNQE